MNPRTALEPITRRDFRHLLVILIMALVHGLLYVFLVPVWQHYDEPNHFEYVWLAANQAGLPIEGDYDQAMSFAVVTSMLDNGFFDDLAEKPVLESPDQPVEIPGYSQLGEPPLYYLLASMPLRWLSSASIESQLTAGRLVSLLLYLITVVAAWGVMLELTSARHPLRWMMPMTLAMLPAFTDLMTAVNSDVGAVALVSMFFWGSARLIRRGMSILDLCWVIAAAALCYFTKNIALFVLLLVPFVLLFSLLRGRLRPIAWALIVIGALVLPVATLVWGDAAYWPRTTSQRELTRLKTNKAVLGDYALALEMGVPTVPYKPPLVFQSLPVDLVTSLHGKDLTFGFWIWADQPLDESGPRLRIHSQYYSDSLSISTEPQFYAYQIRVPKNTERIWVYLDPLKKAPSGIQVYYDGFVLVEGMRPLDIAPIFSGVDGSSGEWGGQPFENILRNPSLEDGTLRVRSVIDDLGVRVLPNYARPSFVLEYIRDWEGMKYFHLASLDRMLRSFWAQFGWGNVSIKWSGVYPMLSVAGIIALVGMLGGMIRKRREIPWEIVFIFVLAVAIAWITTFTRSFLFAVLHRFYVPVARHTYPAIIPVTLFLTFGWLEVFRWVAWIWRWIRVKLGFISVETGGTIVWGTQVPLMLSYGYVWILLDIVALVSIWDFYQ
jgi:hypothetical protein